MKKIDNEKNIESQIVNNSEYDVKFCSKCRDMELFHYKKNKWVCTGCKKEEINE